MTEKKISLTPDQRLAAFALLTMAIQHENSVMRAYRALNKVLGLDEDHQGRMSDLIWGSFDISDLSPTEFDKAMQLEGISVEPDPLADAAHAMASSLSEATEASTDPIFNDAADLIRKLLAELAARPRP